MTTTFERVQENLPFAFIVVSIVVASSDCTNFSVKLFQFNQLDYEFFNSFKKFLTLAKN